MNEIRIQLPKPHPGQQQVLNSKAKWRILQCGRRWGKSLICQIIAITNALSGKHTAYVTPTMELGRVFFQEIIKRLPTQIILSDNKTDREIKLITGGSIKFFSGEVLDSFRGNRFNTAIIDEASFIPDLKNAWGEAILPTLIDYDGDAIFISTPNGMEFFHSLYLRGVNGEPGYESFHFTSYDNPTISRSVIDTLKAEMTETQFRQEILAIPAENASGAFLPEHIRANTITQLSTLPTVVYGVDLAKYGDYSVLCGLDINGHMTHFDRFQLPWVMTQQRILELDPDVLLIVDATGVGDVVMEQLQLIRPNVIGFKFTSESKPKIIYELIRDVEQGKVKFNDVTAQEASVFNYKYTSTGHITFGAASGYHDDAILALSLANHFKNQAIATTTWKLY